MDKNLRDVFNDVCGDLVLDSRLAKSIQDYKTQFINRNSEHVEFFGGNLTGVQVIRFHGGDRARWFSEVLGLTQEEIDSLTERVHSLKSINPEFAVSSDIMNLSCLWLTYALATSTKLNSKQREEAQFNTILILNIKLITSLLFHYFKYPADKEVARATYNALDYKFAIRQKGSWIGVLESRSNDILDSGSIHAKVFKLFNNDEAIVYAANDIQGRLRDMLKNIYAVFMRVHEQGSRIISTSAVIEHDGVEVLRDRTKSLANYTRYLISVVPDENSLLKEELLQVIERQMRTMPTRGFRQTLQWFSTAHGGKDTTRIDQALADLLLHAFDYLQANRFLMRNTTDLASILTKLKGTYTSSRNTNQELITLRTTFEKFVKEATGIRNDAVIASIRTGVMLYLVMRALAMKHYTQ